MSMQKVLQIFLLIVCTYSSNLYASYNEDFNSFPYGCALPSAPHDYRKNDQKSLNTKRQVEGAHFTVSVQRGLQGNAGSLAGDLKYVLDHFPNHPKALLVVAESQMKPGYRANVVGRTDRYWPSKECYFKRALDFAFNDPMVHLVIGIFYHKQKNTNRALKYYKKSLHFDPGNPEAHYNLGLLYFDMKEYLNARSQAKKAMGLGFPLNGLVNKLEKVNEWK